jgi:hypothetical protein
MTTIPFIKKSFSFLFEKEVLYNIERVHNENIDSESGYYQKYLKIVCDIDLMRNYITSEKSYQADLFGRLISMVDAPDDYKEALKNKFLDAHRIDVCRRFEKLNVIIEYVISCIELSTILFFKFYDKSKKFNWDGVSENYLKNKIICKKNLDEIEF